MSGASESPRCNEYVGLKCPAGPDDENESMGEETTKLPHIFL